MTNALMIDEPCEVTTKTRQIQANLHLLIFFVPSVVWSPWQFGSLSSLSHQIFWSISTLVAIKFLWFPDVPLHRGGLSKAVVKLLRSCQLSSILTLTTAITSLVTKFCIRIFNKQPELHQSSLNNIS